MAGEAVSNIVPYRNDDLTLKTIAERTATSAIVGGTAAAITGGNFANGAKTAAYGELYNGISHAMQEEAQKQVVHDGELGGKQLVKMAGDLLIDYTQSYLGSHRSLNFDNSLGLGITAEYGLSLTEEGLMQFKGIGAGIAFSSSVNEAYTFGSHSLGFTSRTSIFAGHVVGGGGEIAVGERGPSGSVFFGTGEGLSVETVLGKTSRLASWGQIHNAWDGLF